MRGIEGTTPAAAGAVQQLQGYGIPLQQRLQAQRAAGGGDVASITERPLLTEEEARAAMVAVRESVGATPTEALSIHGGLDPARVAALLEGL